MKDFQPFYWLNDFSQQFLSRGYLSEGERPLERIETIARVAEHRLRKRGFSNKFMGYMADGDYSLSSPIWSNFGRERGLPISCVYGETWINTEVGGGKQAKDIELGDKVLTHKGRYRKVTAIIPTKGRGDIWKMKISNRMTPLYLTGDHLVMTNVGWIRVDEIEPTQHLVAINGDVETETASYTIDLKPFCVKYEPFIKDGKICKLLTKQRPSHLKLRKNQETVDYFSNPFEKIEVDEEIAWFLGVWFAEGSLSINDKKEPNGIRITINNKDECWVKDRWLEIARRRFGVNGGFYETNIIRNDKPNSWWSVNVNSGIIGEFFKTFGNGCKEKLIPQWLIESRKSVVSEFLNGVLIGDGSVKKRGNRITISNPKMLLQLYQIGLILGEPMSLQMQEKPGKHSTTKHTYTIHYRDYQTSKARHTGGSAIKFHDGLFYGTVKSLEKTDKILDVYDFTVEEDHSFSAAGVVLHNCFGSHISDNMESILDTNSEIGMMSKHGGGTSAYFGNIRPRGSAISSGGESDGAVSFMRIFDTTVDVSKQAAVRRGSMACYLPIEHGDIMEFLKIRTEGHPIQHLLTGVTVGDEWFQSMIDGDQEKRTVWAQVIRARSENGIPYIMFRDNANKNAPQVYKDKGLEINASNLCNEIMLPSDADNSFVCCLSSMNLARYDAWKDTDAVETLTYFLDAVMGEFVEKGSGIKHMHRAVNFARNHRALGLGVLGWHSLLQDRMIPFESLEATYLNNEIFKLLDERTLEASKQMADEYGEPPLLAGYGLRNATRMAIAPTTSSSTILGQVSQSIEPLKSNYYVKDLAKLKYTFRNPALKRLLEEKGEDTEATWKSILVNNGSVQRLSFLSEREKDVFRTFAEISQKAIIIQAAQRQKFIDQGQSLNLMIHPSTPAKDINELLIEAWRLGIKGLYYSHSMNSAQEFYRSLSHCASCEG